MIRSVLSHTLVLLLFLHCAFGAHDLDEEYRFSTNLDADGDYKLHWTFDLEAKTIAFAVNVSTTGWLGFGLSPNGQMPRSDVIIGWVEDDGQVVFHDRYAVDRFLPPIDESQDWFLVSGEEVNGRTILEFTRNLTSCDDKDLNIEANTARILWSYHSNDPVSAFNIPRHQVAGSSSVNLLGGLVNKRIEPDSNDFTLTVENVTIPAVDTTYWCSVGILPTEVREQERYMYKLAPEISEGSKRFVHHILVYLCKQLDHSFVGASSPCEDTHIDIRTCRGTGTVIAAWAVGGEEFVFPEGLSVPLGGEGARRYVVVEMHYDNPSLESGVVDNSGMRFSYTNTPPLHRVGVLVVGGSIGPDMIIPPGADDFTVSALCSEECSKAYFPPEGITIFGNLLHTHLAGHGLVVQQLRENDQCGLLEELQPIDENRQYDFNFQQFSVLPREVKVLPGDQIQIQCFYRTTGPSYIGVTLGGESTRDEMCFSFMYYYPETDLAFCSSTTEGQAYQTFANRHLNESLHDDFFDGLKNRNHDKVRSVLNTVDWTQDTRDSLQQLLLSSNQSSLCISANGFEDIIVTSGKQLPSIDCPYVEPDTCTGQEAPQCCSTSRTDSTNAPPTDPSSTTEFDLGMSGASKMNYFPVVLHSLWISIALLFTRFH